MSIDKRNKLSEVSNNLFETIKELRNDEFKSYSCGLEQFNSLTLADEFDKLWNEFNRLRVKLSFLENK